MEILVTENLRKYYQLGDATVRALDGISLTVEKGEFIAIVGRSGKRKIYFTPHAGRSGCAHIRNGDRGRQGHIRYDKG